MNNIKIIRFNTFLNLLKKQNRKFYLGRTEFRIYKRKVYLFATFEKILKDKIKSRIYEVHYKYYRIQVPNWLDSTIKSFKDETLANNARDMKEAFNKFLNYGSRK